MENIRDAGFDEMFALCRGGCSCATCHVIVDHKWTGALPAMGTDENDLPDSSSNRHPNGRLSCQIPFTDELDGIRVQIALED